MVPLILTAEKNIRLNLKRVILCAVVNFFCCFIVTGWAFADDNIKIGILADGPYWSNQPLLDNVHKELSNLLNDRVKIFYPEDAVFIGDFDTEKIKKYSHQLANNVDLDVILTIGPESAIAFSQMAPLPKPVVAMSVPFPIELGLVDPKTLIPTNPNWTTSFDPSVDKKIAKLLPMITPFDKITVICSSLVCDKNSHFQKAIIKNLRKGKINLEILPVSKTDFAKKISNLDTSLVFVGRLFGFSENEYESFFNELALRKIRSYTVDSIYGIKRGALASIHEIDFVKEGRNYALKIFDIINGTPANEITVKDFIKTKLRFNLETARRINYNIPLILIDDAELYGEKEKHKVLTFSKAFQTALQQNYNIKIQSLIENQSLIRTEEIERGFYPQLFSNLNYSRIDETRADITSEPRGETKFELSLQQKLFDRELSKSIESAKYTNVIDQRNLQVINQDITEQVALAYMDNLLGDEIVRIQKEFLNILRKNLDIAQLKFDLRETGKGDVLRLEIDMENARIDLVDAQEFLFRAQARLNNLLSLPKETLHEYELQPFSETAFVNREKRFEKFYWNHKNLKLTRDFFTETALANSPEIKSIDASIQQSNVDKELVKSRFLPTAELGASWFTQLQDDSKSLTAANQKVFDDRFGDGWTAQLKLNIPIFQGGARFKQLDQANTRILEFLARRKSLENDIAESTRTGFFNVVRSKRNTTLSIRNVKSSKENLKLAEISYREGDLPIIDLLDSQSRLILSQRDSIQTRFDFYKTLFSLFRNIGITNLISDFLDDETIGTFRNRMDQYLDEKSLAMNHRGNTSPPLINKETRE